MKGFLTLLILILCQAAFGQFGVIADMDGFANIRKSPNIDNNIIDKLANGEIVFCFEKEGEWFPIDYDLNAKEFKSGYLHSSRVKLIDRFEKIPYDLLTDSVISFKKDTLKLIVTKTVFHTKHNKLDYHKGNTSRKEMNWLEKINGKKVWGTDGNVPRKQYGQMTLTLGKDKIQLPIDNLFEPNLDYTTVTIDEKNKTVYIAALNGDGAGGYAVLWIIENGVCKERITTIPF